MLCQVCLLSIEILTYLPTFENKLLQKMQSSEIEYFLGNFFIYVFDFSKEITFIEVY